jgi:hypothetical protein
MTDTNFDLNTADGQRNFDVIPANTICTLQMTIRPGGAGDDGLLKRSADGKSEGLDCEFQVVEPEQYRKKKFWQVYTLSGATPGHEQAGKISLGTLRGIVESARGIRPDDKSEAAIAARNVSAASLDQIRFLARLGVRPPQNGYPAKNTILEVITPDRQEWRKPEQVGVKPTNSGAQAAPTTTPPANAIARPEWGR